MKLPLSTSPAHQTIGQEKSGAPQKPWRQQHEYRAAQGSDAKSIELVSNSVQLHRHGHVVYGSLQFRAGSRAAAVGKVGYKRGTDAGVINQGLYEPLRDRWRLYALTSAACWPWS